MVKWIFEELLRFLLVNIICAVGAFLLNLLIIGLVVEGLFKIEIVTTFPFFIAGAIGGVLVGMIGLGGSYGSSHDDYREVLFGSPDLNKPPHAFPVYLFVLVIATIFAGGAGLSTYFCKDIFNALLTVNDEWSILYIVLGSFAGSSVIFMIYTMIFYAYETCTSCGHIFCLTKTFAGSTQSRTTEYRDVNKRDKVGSVGGSDVYASYTEHQSREVTVTHNRYNCHCDCCGAEFQQTRDDVDHGKWG